MCFPIVEVSPRFTGSTHTRTHTRTHEHTHKHSLVDARWMQGSFVSWCVALAGIEPALPSRARIITRVFNFSWSLLRQALQKSATEGRLSQCAVKKSTFHSHTAVEKALVVTIEAQRENVPAQTSWSTVCGLLEPFWQFFFRRRFEEFKAEATLSYPFFCLIKIIILFLIMYLF